MNSNLGRFTVGTLPVCWAAGLLCLRPFVGSSPHPGPAVSIGGQRSPKDVGTDRPRISPLLDEGLIGGLGAGRAGTAVGSAASAQPRGRNGLRKNNMSKEERLSR
jgi:hypothetical protein